MNRHALATSLAILLLGAVSASAQMYQPLIDPAAFEQDYEFFAPAREPDLGRLPPPRTGFYSELHRMYIFVERPNEASRLGFAQTGDWTWANRFDFGYMTEQDHGWAFSAFDLSGINANDVLTIPMINRINTDFNDFLDPANAGMRDVVTLPIQDRNNDLTNQRDFLRTNSINDGRMTSIEINKTFRLKPLHDGSYFEPLLGLRYVRFIDRTERDTYLRLDDDGLPLDMIADLDARIERLTLDQTNFTNNMVGGQLGFRYVYPSGGRWTMSSELRVFAFQNWQEYQRTINQLDIHYDGIGDDSGIDTEDYRRTNLGGNHTEFVYGTDVRLQAAFALTRDISLSTGVQYMDFIRGVARGNQFNQNAESMGMLGVLFGAEFRR